MILRKRTAELLEQGRFADRPSRIKYMLSPIALVDLIHRRKQKYNQYVERFLKDGIIDEGERWKLEQVRKELGLDSDEALQLLHGIMQRARQTGLAKCPHCGESLH